MTKKAIKNVVKEIFTGEDSPKFIFVTAVGLLSIINLVVDCKISLDNPNVIDIKKSHYKRH